MSSPSYNNLLNLLIGIRDETQIHANTAERVGTALIRLLQYLNDAPFLHKDREDSTDYMLRMNAGLEIADFLSGLLGTGGVFRKDADGKTYIEADKIYIRMKAYFDTIEVRKYIHSGGNRIASMAGIKCVKVEGLDGQGTVTENLERAVKFRCYFRGHDGEDSVTNDFLMGDLAFCKDTGKGIHRFWRKVIGKNAEGVLADDEFHWIDLSNVKGEYEEGSDIPLPQDDIIQLGNVDDTTRQGAIVEYVSGEDAPSYLVYSGIDGFSLEGKNQIALGYNSQTGHAYIKVLGDAYIGASDGSSYLKYDQARQELEIRAKVRLGSTLEDGRPLNDLGTQRGNLIMNSGFTGEYETESVTPVSAFTEESAVWSAPLRYWFGSNVEVCESADTVSGRKVTINSGTLGQDIVGVREGWYMLAFMGDLEEMTVSIASFSREMSVSPGWYRYEFPFYISSPLDMAILMFEGSGDIADVMLTEGTLPCEWAPAEADNDKARAEYDADEYLRSAIQDGNTEILGGLILSQLIKVGQWRDDQMKQETGGMSGLYNSEASPFLWGGGSLKQAFYTIRKYLRDPGYQASEEEVAQMTKFVVTHGGRAILSDVILRGYIYALGGVFRGKVYANDGEFRGKVYATDGEFKGRVEASEGSFKGTLDIGENSFHVNRDGSGQLAGGLMAWDAAGRNFSGLRINGSYLKIANFLSLDITEIDEVNSGDGNYYMTNNGDAGSSVNVVKSSSAVTVVFLPQYASNGNVITVKNLKSSSVTLRSRGTGGIDGGSAEIPIPAKGTVCGVISANSRNSSNYTFFIIATFNS